MRKTGISRRRFLRFGLEAVAAAGCVGAASALAHNGSYVRPPGAAEKLTGLCIRCGACVEACPERALKQLDLSLDFFNLGTPVLNYRRAGCVAWGIQPRPAAPERPLCVACMESCPSGALDVKRFDPAERNGYIGKAYIWPEKCVNCMECFRVCPVSGAVLFPNSGGKPYKKYSDIPVKLKYENSVFKPFIETSLCVGCGRCAAICPPRVIDVQCVKKPS